MNIYLYNSYEIISQLKSQLHCFNLNFFRINFLHINRQSSAKLKKKMLKQLFIFFFACYLSIDGATFAEPRAPFGRVCGRFQTYEKLFSGDCYLSQDKFPEFLQSTVDKALAFDPAKSVDELFREFLPKMLKFFEETYTEEYGSQIESIII